MVEKDIGQYPILTEVINELVEKALEERPRYLAIALGLVFGSAEAYQKQVRVGQQVYFRNFVADEAFEGGLVAEEVRNISQNPERLKKRLREVPSLFNGPKPESCSIQRLYGIFKIKKPITEEELRRLGRYVENMVKERGGNSFEIQKEKLKEESSLNSLEFKIIYQRQRGNKQLEEMGWLIKGLHSYFNLSYSISTW